MSGWFAFPDSALARRVATERITMFAVEAGQGPPVVLIHGLGWDASLWHPTIDRLARQYRVLAADSRGHGETDKPEGPYTIDLFAADWAALLDRCGVADACIVGLSQGGMVAQALAALRPDLVSTLVLVSTSCKSNPSGRSDMEARIAAIAEAGPLEAAKVAAESIFSAAWREANAGELARFLNWRCLAPSAPLVSAMRAVFGVDLRAVLPTLPQPTLVIAGAADTLTRPEEMEEIAALVPGARLAQISGAGHIIPVEAPDAFAHLLDAFLAEHVPVTGSGSIHMEELPP